MKGWQIFTHSIRQVFGNMNAVLRVSGVLYLVQLAATLTIGGSMLLNQAALQASIERGGFPWAQFAIVMLISTVTGLWIAVGWHRYILTVEEPGLLPAFHGDRMLGYFGKGILIGLIMIIPGLVIGFIIGFIGAFIAHRAGPEAFTSGSAPIVALIITGLIAVPLIILALRLSTALPGVALKPEVSVWSGWEATKGENGTFFVLSLILVAVQLILTFVPLVFGGSITLTMIWQVIITWVATMVGVSILTTLYGHYIEKRPLV